MKRENQLMVQLYFGLVVEWLLVEVFAVRLRGGHTVWSLMILLVIRKKK